MISDAEILERLDAAEALATRTAQEACKEGDIENVHLAYAYKCHIQRQRARVLEIISARKPEGIS